MLFRSYCGQEGFSRIEKGCRMLHWSIVARLHDCFFPHRLNLCRQEFVALQDLRVIELTGQQ